MPELPEIENIKRYLEKKIIGQTIEQIKILSPKQFIGDPKLILRKKITGLHRRAKILFWQLEGNLGLLIHLKLTGQIVYAEKLTGGKAIFGHPIPFAGGSTLPGKSTRIIIFLSQGTIFFNDLRKFGWIKVIKNDEGKIKELTGLGREPLAEDFTPTYLKTILAGSRQPIKLVLMDQTKIAGIGNIYANEALWWAKIDPRTPANQVKKISSLWRAIRTVLEKGIRSGGTSTADEAYVQPNGRPGEYQKHLAVYQREGKPCPRCGTPIARIKINHRSTFFCPHCQR